MALIGARWAPRGSLELQIGDLVPSKDTAIAVTCNHGVSATLAGATLKELGYRNISVLEGGVAAWQAAGFAVETGLTRIMRPPTDVILSGPDRNSADAINYLRWETALGEKYAT